MPSSHPTPSHQNKLILSTGEGNKTINIMEADKIIEGNRFIAEFLGYKVFNKRYPLNHGIGAPEAFEGYKSMIVQKAKYHTSWDWLMPVVEKIESIRHPEYGWFQVSVQGNSCSIQSEHLWKVLQGHPNKTYKAYTSDPDAIFPTKIESTWYVVVEFIKWYNTHQQ